ncbi:hypothetical protein BIY24_04975 [Halobacteriovorax marinus]|uniref:hypothetical protein n=1 Tax=Halobacteriovorax marinus TaxID=97084 RepID=UPI000BC35F8E|nr:hypothetical protein [Halobacteriovorax marinus]ATH07311.1 hypothetical protein BIY24_04975 [Halobacteriovorax marinus]
MKKNFFKFLVLVLATLNLTSSKAVAKEVPLTQENYNNLYRHWVWEPFANLDGMLCKNEDVKYPLVMSKRSSLLCSYDENKNDNYSLLTNELLSREITSLN